jgi:hypothetical protein
MKQPTCFTDCTMPLTLSSDLLKANSTLDKTTKMHYDAQVRDCTLMAKAIGVSQE